VQNVTVVRAFDIHLFSCDRGLWLGKFCKKILFAVSLGWVTNFEANSFNIRYRMEYIYCILQTVFSSKSLLMASSSNVQVQIKSQYHFSFLAFVYQNTSCNRTCDADATEPFLIHSSSLTKLN